MKTKLTRTIAIAALAAAVSFTAASLVRAAHAEAAASSDASSGAPGALSAMSSSTVPNTAATTADNATGTASGAGAGNSTGTAVSFSEPSCGITAADLAAVNTAAENGLLAELAARRALLTRIITCAASDASTLQGEINSVSLDGLSANKTKEGQIIQSQFSGKLGDAITYYGLELAKVPSAGIAGTKGIAQEVLSWRDSNYKPLAENAANFEMWVSIQPLVAAASDRLSGIAGLVSYLEQAGPNDSLQSDLSTAQTLVQSAKNANQTAENGLMQSLPPYEVRAYIQGTLQPLSGAYNSFFDIASTTQSLLQSSK